MPILNVTYMENPPNNSISQSLPRIYASKKKERKKKRIKEGESNGRGKGRKRVTTTKKRFANFSNVFGRVSPAGREKTGILCGLKNVPALLPACVARARFMSVPLGPPDLCRLLHAVCFCALRVRAKLLIMIAALALHPTERRRSFDVQAPFFACFREDILRGCLNGEGTWL